MKRGKRHRFPRFPRFERTQENALAICQFIANRNLDSTQVSSYVTEFNALVESGQMNLAPVLSADDFLAEHPELRDTRTPPLIEARHAKAANTQKLFEKAQAASAEGATVRVVDYRQEQQGVPVQPDKISFKKKIAAMSADEIRAECAVKPAFREALDNL